MGYYILISTIKQLFIRQKVVGLENYIWVIHKTGSMESKEFAKELSLDGEDRLRIKFEVEKREQLFYIKSNVFLLPLKAKFGSLFVLLNCAKSDCAWR